MSIIHKVWRSIPETPIKDKARVIMHNYKDRGRVSYSIRNSAFLTRTQGVEFVTQEPSFGIGKHLGYYLARRKINRGETVIDAGAYTGHLSLFMACKVGSSGKIVAFEPDELNIMSLNKNIELNRKLHNITIVKELLWNKIDMIDFCAQGSVASSSFWIPEGQSTMKKLTTTIDIVVDSLSLQQVDFIKMNIEGAEIKAVEGAIDTIRKFKPDFAIASNHTVDGKYTCYALEELLKDFGYTVETIFYAPTYCYTYAYTDSSRS